MPLDVRLTQLYHTGWTARDGAPTGIVTMVQTRGEIDSGDRVCVAAAMVGLCIKQFQLKLRWLHKLEEALFAGDTTGRDSEP